MNHSIINSTHINAPGTCAIRWTDTLKCDIVEVERDAINMVETKVPTIVLLMSVPLKFAECFWPPQT